MKMDILITKDDVTLYNKSVTSADIPSEVITIFKEVRGCELIITRD